MREPVGEVPLFGFDRVQQVCAKVARFAKDTGGRDPRTFPWLQSDWMFSINCMVFLNTPLSVLSSLCFFPVA